MAPRNDPPPPPPNPPEALLPEVGHWAHSPEWEAKAQSAKCQLQTMTLARGPQGNHMVGLPPPYSEDLPLGWGGAPVGEKEGTRLAASPDTPHPGPPDSCPHIPLGDRACPAPSPSVCTKTSRWFPKNSCFPLPSHPPGQGRGYQTTRLLLTSQGVPGPN